MNELRLYSFVNFYLSSIQQGVQTAHLVHELFTEWQADPKVQNASRRSMLEDWAKNHKTIIILNGGAHQDISEMMLFLMRESQSFSWAAPFGAFNEDERSLNGIITCCGLVVPERVYGSMNYRNALAAGIISDTADKEAFFYKDESGLWTYMPNTSDHRFIGMLKACPLAR